MNARATRDPFSWDVPDDEQPIPLAAGGFLVAIDGFDVPSGDLVDPEPDGVLGTPHANSPEAAGVGWPSRFTAGVVASSVLAFGVGWTWRGGRLPVDAARGQDGVTSTNGNAATEMEGASR